ncbi:MULTISPECIES: sigma-70 family RNA polymerase sigma factor [Myxococcus]|uniref:sigma-70 family RNA polymerase sigma factor n=1 Tax=Myxococcus TaxID=32 RepID=UPI001143FED9|nr:MULTISPECIES: sigma-70 family RNA polymerase sigma factor [Myxococcus]MCK8503473.1 sigma-70 family RNA polymerase sigma factor [Myxococcus fulvus]
MAEGPSPAPQAALLAMEEHRTALTGHCYRMLGSIAEAEDAVQETFVRALRNLEHFEGRSSARTWLYRIATHRCIDVLQERTHRVRPMELGPPGPLDAPLGERPGEEWLEPVPDALVVPSHATPAELVMMRQSIRLAFVAALQHLPPRQRAALLLTEVLDWSAAEVADALELTVPAVNSALQRARATLATKDVSTPRAPLSENQASLVDRYVDAFERYDMAALTALLHQEVNMSMPPLALWVRGPEQVALWMEGRGAACRGSRLVPVSANGAPAFGQYKPGGPDGTLTPWALNVLEIEGERIVGLNYFLDAKTLFPRFGLPPFLPAR